MDNEEMLHDEMIANCNEGMAYTSDGMGHVHKRRQATPSIATCCPLKLIVPDKTRWKSIYIMLEKGLRLRREITTFLGSGPLKRMVDARERARARNKNLNKLVHIHIGLECWSTYEALVQVLSVIKWIVK